MRHANSDFVGAGSPSPDSVIAHNLGAREPRPYRHKPTLGQIVAYFKYHPTKLINEIRNAPVTKQTRKRKSIRLKEYDYSLEGAYFVTVCTHHREHVFGEIASEQMQANNYGNIVRDCWYGLPNHYTNIELDQFVVMPNHVHGIIVILDNPIVGAGLQNTTIVGARHANSDFVGAGSPRPETDGLQQHGAREPRPYRHKPTLGQIVAYFKYHSTKRINEIRNTPGTPLWQRGYFEHIIRNEKSLNRIREYIHTNPQRWDFDHENPSASHNDEFDRWIKLFKKSSL